MNNYIRQLIIQTDVNYKESRVNKQVKPSQVMFTKAKDLFLMTEMSYNGFNQIL